MKKKYFFTIITSLLFICNVSAQGTETFDNEAGGSTTFSENGFSFNISSSTGENYDVFEDGFTNTSTAPLTSDQCANCGWSGTAPDQKFVDLTGTANSNGVGNGSSFTVSTANGSEITIKSLYIFCSTSNFTAHSGTLSIQGRKDGANVTGYNFTFSGTFANPVSFTPNNGFTLIDMATAHTSDLSNTNVDELVITSTGNLDYMALDAFTWGAEVLSTDNFQLETKPKLFPNPASDTISISNLQSETEYSIADISGKTIDSGKTASNDYIDISKLEVGIYFLRLSSNEIIRFIKK